MCDTDAESFQMIFEWKYTLVLVSPDDSKKGLPMQIKG